MGKARVARVVAGYAILVTGSAAGAAALPAGLAPVADLLRAAVLVLTFPVGLVLPLAHLSAYGWVVGVALVNALLWAGLWRLRPGRRAELAVEGRLAWALGVSGLAVTPMARARGPVRTGDGRWRYARSLLLRDVPLPFRELTARYVDSWTRAGLRVNPGQAGTGLRAYDDQGYEYGLTPGPGPFGDAVLEVCAPPQLRLDFPSGAAAAGALVSLCVTTLLVTDSDRTAGAALCVLRFGGVAALVGGLLLTRRRSARAGGAGLVTGALLALVVFLAFT